MMNWYIFTIFVRIYAIGDIVFVIYPCLGNRKRRFTPAPDHTPTKHHGENIYYKILCLMFAIGRGVETLPHV